MPDFGVPLTQGGSVLLLQGELETPGTGATASNANLGAVTFTFPPNGKVQLKVKSVTVFAGSCVYNLFAGSTSGSGASNKQYGTFFLSSAQGLQNAPVQLEGSVLITGGTPGASTTVYINSSASTTNANIYGLEYEVYSA